MRAINRQFVSGSGEHSGNAPAQLGGDCATNPKQLVMLGSGPPSAVKLARGEPLPVSERRELKGRRWYAYGWLRSTTRMPLSDATATLQDGSSCLELIFALASTVRWGKIECGKGEVGGSNISS